MTSIRRRIELLEALAIAQEATARAMLMLLASDDDPPNVVRAAEKTGPRVAYGERTALAHIRRVYDEARTASERERVRRVAKRLAGQGMITDDDVSSLGEPGETP